MEPRFFDNNGVDFAESGNGSGQVLIGLPLGKLGAATYSAIVLSSKWDQAAGFHWQPFVQTGPVRFAVGIQDMRGNGGAAGTDVPGDEEDSSSVYGVATWNPTEPLFVSLGFGESRFDGAFGSASYRLDERTIIGVEHDSFHLNAYVGYSLSSRIKGKDTWYTDPETSAAMATEE